MHGMSGEDVEILRAIKRGREAGSPEEPTEIWKTFLIIEHTTCHEHLVQESIDRMKQFLPGFKMRIEKIETRRFDK